MLEHDIELLTERELQEQLLEARKLIHQLVKHLDYCNYGDQWERECAQYSKLPKRADEYVKKYKLE